MTHISLCLANFFRNKCKYKTAYIELNATDEIANLANNKDASFFRYKNIDFYPNATLSSLTELLDKNYKIFVIDFGVMNPRKMKDLFRCTQKICICPSAQWKTVDTSKESNINYEDKDIKLLVNLVEKKPNFKASKKFFTFPFLQNPFHLTPQYFQYIEMLVTI